MIYKGFQRLLNRNRHLLRHTSIYNYSMIESMTSKKQEGQFKKEMEYLMSKPEYTLRDFYQKVFYLSYKSYIVNPFQSS